MEQSAVVIAKQYGMKRAGHGYIGTCPGCGYRDALSMLDGNDGRLLLYCHVGCAFREIAQTLGGRGSSDRRDPSFDQQRSVRVSAKDRATLIKRLIAQSVSAADSVVQVYLSDRGITLAPPSDLRYLPRHRHTPSKKYLSVMLGIVRDVTGEAIGLHRTYLAPGGATQAMVEPTKMSLGSIAGGAVRLHDLGADLPSLAVTEGIETGLSVAQATGLPVWAALSAGGIERLILPPLPEGRQILIFADRDHHGRGQQAAEHAAGCFANQGRQVKVVLPPNVDIDFNDMLQASG